MAKKPVRLLPSAATGDPKRQLLARLLKKDGAPKVEREPIPRRQSGAPAPLSFAQERLWFLQQWEPSNPAYNLARAYRLTGPLDGAVLARSLEIICQRHEILRSRFLPIGDQPVQQVSQDASLPLHCVDLRHQPRRVRELETARLISAEARHGFDLAAEPPLRLSLLQHGADHHVLILVVHQIIFDGRSLDIFYRELETLYASGGTAGRAQLAQPALQYADYAAWQREALPDAAFANHLSYWMKRLEGQLPILELPSDRPRAVQPSLIGGRRNFVVDEALTGALKRLSRKSSTTLFVTLMAAFEVLLFRHSAQEDVIVGFPIATRDRPELESLIGNFVNTLPLRSDLSGNPSFAALLARVRAAVQGALAHHELPFERLVEEFPRERDLNRNPLFQTMFTFQNRLPAELNLSGIHAEPIACDAGAAKFDLTLSCGERDGRLFGSFEYSGDLFDSATIDRMIGHLQTLLSGITADSRRPVAALPLLTPGERKRILVQWNDTALKFATDRCVHQLFEAQVLKTPNAVAVEYAGRRLTFSELNGRANRLARYLRQLGLGPDKLAAICVRRSLEMIIGLLGIFKAGGAYVPLDPRYPRQRLGSMLRDSQACVLLVDARFMNDASAKSAEDHSSRALFDSNIKRVPLDDRSKVILPLSDKNLRTNVTPKNIAYVIYTSGSTGQPKGVVIEHRNVVAFLHWARSVYSRAELAGVLASTSICFDLSVFELFAPLCWGGKVILADDVLALQEPRKSNSMGSATLINTVPSAMNELLAAGALPPSVKTVNLAGEPLKPELVRRLYESGRVRKVYDLYGPSETTTYSTFMLRTGEPCESIGRPIANTVIYLLNSALEPVPVGVVGEIFIGGAGVARGYLHCQELTAERFIPDPFSKVGAGRLYRTGDLARYRADGMIEYLGRADDQVKIRGHRIELGEIEAALGRHPRVRECAVLAQVVAADGKFQIADSQSRSSVSDIQLVAYVVPSRGQSLDAAELRNFLRQTLPQFMVPAGFTVLDALPLTPNGKVDRKALPTSDGGLRPLAGGFRAPQGEIEELIAQVWRESLKLDEISADDNFFNLGGHSLLATRVAARLRANFNIELPLRKLFELPTIAALAVHVDELHRARSGGASAAILPAARRGALPLSSAQQRLWFLHKLDPASSAYNIPAAHRIHGSLNVNALAAALDEIVARHESLRTAIVEIDGRPMQRILAKAALSVPITDLSQLAADQTEAEVSRLVSKAARLPFDLSDAPLMRAKLLRLGAEDHVLVLNFHHIIADASSLAEFYRELAILYEAFAEGRPAGLPALTVQFADYASWQQEWISGREANASLEYWRRRLDGAVPLDLPADYRRPARQSYHGGRIARRLTADMTRALKELSRRSGATLFMTLLAAFAILLARLSGREDIVIGSTIAGRSRAELLGLIGFFINALALRIDLSGQPSFTDLVRRAREVCLDAYTHQDLPFEKIVEALNPERDLSRNPLFDVMFNSNEKSDRALKLKNCRIEKILQAEPAAKFDIVLYAPEVDGCIELAMVYNADLFSHTRMSIYLEQLAYLLEQVVAAPEQSIDRLSLLTPSSLGVLPDPAATLDDSWRGAVHTLIWRRAQTDPTRLAVIDGNASWSYRELDEQSSRLANYLLSGGIRRGAAIAIYAQRNASLVVALLGALKAGAVFVVLDPAYPVGRLLDYLRIARPKGWLQLDPVDELPAALADFLETAQLSCRLTLPRDKIEMARLLSPCSAGAPNLAVCADDHAYIAFTSGSTGQPKGVLCRHGPMSYFLPWQQQEFNLADSDRYCLLSGLGYNHLQREVFTALASGATLCIPTEAQVKSPDQLTAWLGEFEITILHLTPAFGRLLQTAAARPLPSLRRIFFGGDLLTRQDLAAMRRLAPNAKIVSFYGATETQRAVGYRIIDDDEKDCVGGEYPILPTGKGAPAVQLLLLTPTGRLAGIGEMGELYLRSPHLAAGYVGDDDLTTANFVVNPCTGAPRDRLYRTGELGRYRTDGNVEWVGRRGRRVSIRGFRVELVEVEGALSQHPAVRAAAVVENAKLIMENSQSVDGLTAYVVADDSERDLISELRVFVAARLPHYMVPGEFVVIERMPLSPNGKVDYRALAALDRQHGRATLFDPPRSVMERALAAIFAEVLAIEPVGRQDNFFHRGGHSLLAAQAAARIRQSLGIRLDLRLFFEAPTVAALANRLESMRGTAPSETEREEIEL